MLDAEATVPNDDATSNHNTAKKLQIKDLPSFKEFKQIKWNIEALQERFEK